MIFYVGFNIYRYKNNEAVKTAYAAFLSLYLIFILYQKVMQVGYLGKNQNTRLNNFNTPLPLIFPTLYQLLWEKI